LKILANDDLPMSLSWRSQ